MYWCKKIRYVVQGLEQFSWEDQFRLFSQSQLVIGAIGTSFHFMSLMQGAGDGSGGGDGSGDGGGDGSGDGSGDNNINDKGGDGSGDNINNDKPTITELAPTKDMRRAFYECDNTWTGDKHGWIGGNARQVGNTIRNLNKNRSSSSSGRNSSSSSGRNSNSSSSSGRNSNGGYGFNHICIPVRGQKNTDAFGDVGPQGYRSASHSSQWRLFDLYLEDEVYDQLQNIVEKL